MEQSLLRLFILLSALFWPVVVCGGLTRRQLEELADSVTDHPAGSTHLPLGQHKVLISTAVHTEPCHSAVGGYTMLLSLKNKQDYANIHHYGFHWSIEQPDPELQGPWNKIAVLQMLLDKYPPSEVEWLLWLDNDVLFLDMGTALDLSGYEGRHLIYWGCEKASLVQRNEAHSINGGAFLLRNSDWSRTFLQDLARDYGRLWFSKYYKDTQAFKELEQSVVKAEWGTFEQTAIVHMLKMRPQLADGVDCDMTHPWHLLYKYNWTVSGLHDGSPLPLVVHWAGCQFCRSRWVSHVQGHVRECVLSFLEVFAAAHQLSVQLLGEGRALEMAHITSIVLDELDREEGSSSDNEVPRRAIRAIMDWAITDTENVGFHHKEVPRRPILDKR